MLHFCVIFGMPLLYSVICCSKGDKVTNDVSGQIALPTSDNPIEVVEDLSERLLYKFEVMCISIAWKNFIRMKLLATCYLVYCLQCWDHIIHQLLMLFDQCPFPASSVCIHIICIQLNENQTFFRFRLGTEQEMEKASVPPFS